MAPQTAIRYSFQVKKIPPVSSCAKQEEREGICCVWEKVCETGLCCTSKFLDFLRVKTRIPLYMENPALFFAGIVNFFFGNVNLIHVVHFIRLGTELRR